MRNKYIQIAPQNTYYNFFQCSFSPQEKYIKNIISLTEASLIFFVRKISYQKYQICIGLELELKIETVHNL